jgi:membrane protein YqaA with SNARE-associated domain
MSPVMTVLMTLVVSAAGAVVPLVNTELYLLGVAAVVPSELAAVSAVAAAVGQMAGKCVLYVVARSANGWRNARLQRALAEAHRRFGKRGALGAVLVMTSAAAGLPPFYVVAVACGALRWSFSRFLVLGLVGRTVRFGAVVLAPQLVRDWL